MNPELSRMIEHAVRHRQNPSRALVVAAVGAGGKTTTVHALGRLLSGSGLKAVVTTTTKMGCEAERCEGLDEVEGCLMRGETVVFAHRADAAHMAGPDDSEWRRLLELSDVVLVEADGAKRHGFKVPAPHEPVLPEETDLALILYDAHTCGEAFDTAVFRIEQARRLMTRCGRKPDAERLDAELMRFLIREGYLKNPRMCPNAHIRYAVIANRCDTAVLERLGEYINEGIGDGVDRPVSTYVNTYSEDERWR